MPTRPRRLERGLLSLLVASLLVGPMASAGELSVLIDRDDDLGTGCSVSTPDGPFDGVETVLVTTVDDGLDQVTAVEVRECVGGVLGAPAPVLGLPLPWAVGLASGMTGSDVVETAWPLSEPLVDATVRLGFTTDDLLGSSDAMLADDGTPTGQPILLVGLPSDATEIPTASLMGLVALALLLALGAAWMLRRHPGAGVSIASWLIAILASSGVLWALGGVILDGDPSEWAAVVDALGFDAVGDAPGADLEAGFAALSADGSTIAFRFDLFRDQPPTAVDDAATVSEGDPATAIDVLANDVDADGGVMQVEAVSDPAGGTVAITGGGTGVRYEPDPGFCNDGTPTDDFIYTLNGGSSATVQVTVTCANGPAIAVDDTATVTEDDPATAITVLTNDSDPEMDAFSITGTSDPAGGAVVITGGGTALTYEPDPDFCNDGAPTDDFTYTITGGATATVRVTVTCVNDPPMVTNSILVYDAVGNTLLRVDGPDADDHDFGLPGRIASTVSTVEALTAAAPTDVDSPLVVFTPKNGEATDQGGTITLDDDGDFYYVPPPGFTGMDSATAQVVDGEGGSAPVTLQFQVTEMVWYVEDTVDPIANPAGGDGRSTDAFETLAAAEAASSVNATILVFETDSPIDEGITLKSGQKLYGQRVEEEPISLLPPGLLLEEIADTNARPQIHRGSGAAITVDASGGTLSGVEIRHLDLRSGDDDAIAVTTAGTGLVTALLIDENVLRGAGVHGVDLNSSHTSGLATVAIVDNQITATSNALDVTHSAAGSLALSIDRNLAVASTAGRAIQVQRAAGAVFVTSLDGNSVSGDTSGDGMWFSGVTFDGDPSTLAFEVVDGNATVIGGGGNGVGGAGLMILAGSGDLLFDELDIEGAAGFVAAGTGVVDIGAGTGLRLSTGAGSIAATAGPALDLDPLTAALVLDSVMSSNSTTSGIALVDVEGVVTVGAGSITGAVGTAFDVLRGSAAVTYAGTIANTSGRSVSVVDRPGGSTTLSGGVADSGSGILVDGNSGGVTTFSGSAKTLNTGASDAVTLTNNAGHAVSFTNGGLDVDTTSGIGFRASSGGAVTVGTGVSANTITSTAGQAVEIGNVDMNLTLASVSSADSPGFGIRLQGATGTLSMQGGAVSGAMGTAFAVSGGSATVSYSGDLSNVAGRVVDLQSIGGGSVTFDTGTVSDTGGSGILLGNNMGGTVSFAGSVDILGSTAPAVTLDGNSGGAFVFADLDVDNSTSNQVALRTLNSNTGAVLTTTTGILHGGSAAAVDLDHLDLDVTLRSTTSVGGSSPGIDLETVTGSFAVTGDGGGSNNASGGRISMKAGGGDGVDGVRLVDVENVSLGYLDVTDNSRNGIYGSSVNGLVLERCNITNNADQAAPDEAGIHLEGLTGSLLAGTHPTRFANLLVHQSFENNVIIRNNTGTLAELRVDGSTFRDTDPGTGASGFVFLLDETSGTTEVNAYFDTCVFDRNLVSGVAMDTDGGDAHLSVTGSTFTDNNVGAQVSISNDGNATFDISGNTPMTGHGAHPINFFAAASSTGTVDGTIANNEIGTLGTGSSGSLTGYGIRVQNEGAASVDVVIDSNRVYESGVGGILVQDLVNTGTTRARIIGNTVNTTVSRGIQAVARVSSVMCLDVRNNTTVNTGLDGIRVRQRDTSTLQVERFAGGSTSTANMAGHLATENPGAGSTGATVDTTYATPVADGACGF